MLLLASLLAISLPLASAWSNPFHDHERRALDRRADPAGYAFLTNCWANPGARSEVDFYSSYPKNIGSATPQYSYVVQDGSNYVWQDGGSAKDPSGNTFTWTITNKTAAADQKAGTATSGKNKYTLYREFNTTLYTETSNGANYGCIIVYCGQMDSIATSTSSSSTMSATSTSAPTTSAGSAAAATTTPSGVTPTATPQSSGLSMGAKAGIGVGVAVAVLAALAGLAGFLLWRRRRRGWARTPIGVDAGEKKFLPYSAGDGAVPMGGYMPSELHTQSMVSEMPAHGPGEFGRYAVIPHHPVEMDGGSYPTSR